MVVEHTFFWPAEDFMFKGAYSDKYVLQFLVRNPSYSGVTSNVDSGEVIFSTKVLSGIEYVNDRYKIYIGRDAINAWSQPIFVDEMIIEDYLYIHSYVLNTTEKIKYSNVRPYIKIAELICEWPKFKDKLRELYEK